MLTEIDAAARDTSEPTLEEFRQRLYACYVEAAIKSQSATDAQDIVDAEMAMSWAVQTLNKMFPPGSAVPR